MPAGMDVVATAPELWETFVDICMELAIDMTQLPQLTTRNDIVEFVHTLNIQLQPIYKEVTTLEQTGWTWVYNAPVNSSETTDMVVRGITDLTVTGGAATGITSGKKVFGTVSRKIAAGAMIAALGVSTFAAQIGEHISRLVEGLTPWTVDGKDAVPVMIDENGNTYLDERAVQKFREDLINLGIFDGNTCDTKPQEIIDTYRVNLPIARSSLQYMDVMVEDIRYKGYLITDAFILKQDGTKKYPFIPVGETDLINPHSCVFNLVNSNTTYQGFIVCDNNALENHILFLNVAPDNTLSWGGVQSGALNTFNYLNKTMYVFRFGATAGENEQLVCNSLTVPQYNIVYDGTLYQQLAYTIQYGTFEGGVPGFEPTNATVGDLTKSITEIYPDWASNGVDIPSPKDDDLENKSTWLPVSITETEPFEQDHTATSDDQDGDTSEDTQQSIMEKLMELIQTLAQEQAGTDDEVITPTIPVEDSGDTPPATPPLVSGASNGLWTIYNPTLSEVQQFGAWLWSENIIDQIVRQFASPIDGVIGFMSIYCTPITGGRKMIKAGYLESPVSAKEVTNQYVTIDCGSVDVPEYYRTAIDYTRSKVDIYLPFIGIVPLDCSVVTGSTLQVIYRIDVLTGTCLAQIKVIKQNSDAVMYTFNGNCGVQLPLTGGTYTGLVSTLIGLGKAAIGAYTGNAKSIASGLIQAVGSAGADVMKSGTLTSNAGALGIRIPYLIITHPTAYDAMIYNQFYGYPSNVYQRLSAMSGFVRVKKVHLDDITCTDQELEMIYSKLKEGVII